MLLLNVCVCQLMLRTSRYLVQLFPSFERRAAQEKIRIGCWKKLQSQSSQGKRPTDQGQGARSKGQTFQAKGLFVSFSYRPFSLPGCSRQSGDGSGLSGTRSGSSQGRSAQSWEEPQEGAVFSYDGWRQQGHQEAEDKVAPAASLVSGIQTVAGQWPRSKVYRQVLYTRGSFLQPSASNSNFSILGWFQLRRFPF